MKRLCRPVLLAAHIVMWVIAPLPEMSSLFCSGRPHFTRALWYRDSGATYASTPRIGVIPAAIACL
ncbi:hypothetical protein C5N14_18200 [Micromonospora sp. MW-13]|nr:hypothetical protein C5N14_18200 [Micromonospora sp. MW-13]